MMGSGYVPSYPELIDYWLKRIDNWQLRYSIIPRRCSLSQRTICMEYAYKGTRVITGPGTPVIEDFWIAKDEFIIWKLKGN